MAVSEVPQVTVHAQPTVETEAPQRPPDSAKHTTPLEVPATVAINSTIKEANPLSLGGLPQLLAGIDGLIGPPPPPVLAAEARKVAVGAGAGAEAAAADASVAWLDAMREEHTERADSTVPWEAQHDHRAPARLPARRPSSLQPLRPRPPTAAGPPACSGLAGGEPPLEWVPGRGCGPLVSSGAPTLPPLATQETGNYGVLTTSAIEFLFVVDPLDAAKVRLRHAA